MFEFMKLEMRKHRFLFRGIVGAYFSSLIFVAVLALTSGQSPLQFAALTAAVWLVFGLALMTLLYGATSGAGLRSEPAASAEAGLPLSPQRKTLAAIAAMCVYFTALATLFGVSTLLLSPFMEGEKFSLSLPTGSQLGPITLILLAVLLAGFLMILIVFTCAYGFRHAIFGGLIGMLLCGVIAAGMFFGAMTHSIQTESVYGLIGWLVFIPLLSGAGTLFALRRLACWGERRVKPGWLGWLLIGLGMGAGAFAASGWLVNGYSGVSRQLLFRPNNWSAFNFSNDGALVYLDRARKAAAHHTLLVTRSGALVSVADDGKRTLLLHEETRNPVELVKEPWANRILSYDWDEDGSLWVLLRSEISDDSQMELWHGNADAPLKNHTFFKTPPGLNPYRLAHRGAVLGVVAQTDGNNNPNQFAPLPPPGKAPVFEPLGEILKGKAKEYREDDFLLSSWTDSGLRARISDDGESLTRRLQGGGTQTWAFPEGAAAINSSSPYRRLNEAGGDHFFLVSVRFPDGNEAAAICRPDGSVRLEWRGKAAPLYAVQDDEFGQLFVSKHSPKTAPILFMITAEGRFLPPLEVNGQWLSSLPARRGESAGREFSAVPLRMKGTHAWLLDGAHELLEADGETGKLVHAWPLPDFNAPPQYNNDGSYSSIGPVSDTGFHYIAAGRLYHTGFDGVTKDLGPARLD